MTKKAVARIRRAATALSLFLIVVAASAFILDRLFPFPVERLEPAPAVRVLDNDGKPLRYFLAPDGMWRFPVTLDQVSPDLITALIHSEDRYFYYHPGVNPPAVLRAVWSNIRHRRVVSGASTIPMQVARLVSPRPRTISAKMVEALRALQLSAHYPKDQILTWYLNLAPFGGNVVGVGAASWRYFDKDPQALSLGEIALLSVLPRSPSRYNPLKNPDAALRVRNQVLDRFARDHVFDPASIRAARSRPLLAKRAAVPQAAPHFCRRLRSRLPEQGVLHSTLDRRMQNILEASIQSRLKELRRAAIDSVAVVILHTRTREVPAYAGSPDFWDATRQGQVDNALSRRSPGSTLKPFLYVLAFDQGHLTPESMLLDVPTDFGGYMPENYGQDFQGLISARMALATSVNVPAARLLSRCGTVPFHNLLLRGGLHTLDRPAAHYGLSLALGGCEVRLLDLVNLYATLAAGGVHRPVKPLAGPTFHGGTQIFSPEAAAMVLDILTMTRRPEMSDSWEFTVDAPAVAWKTGTSFGHRDAWAVGVNRDLAIGVWVGNPDGSQCKNISGTLHAAPLLFDLFRKLAPGSTALPRFATPALQRTPVCAVSGERPGPDCPVILTRSIAGVTSLPRCTMHKRIFVDPETGLRLHGDCLLNRPVQEETAVVWPPELVAYRMAQGVVLPGLPRVHPDCPDVPEEKGPVIQSLAAGTPYLIRPDAPAEFQRLALTAAPGTGASIHYWYVNDRYVGHVTPETPCFVPLSPGRHDVFVVDDLGRSSRTRFTVRELLPQEVPTLREAVQPE
jgi:penicillin-binding protein 1C